MNKVFIQGNLGQNPECREFQNNNGVANFSVATTERYKDGEEWKDRTEWVNVAVFNGWKFVKDYITKGDSVLIEGKLRTSSYESNGATRYKTEVIVDRSGSIKKLNRATPSETRAMAPETDDLPF